VDEGGGCSVKEVLKIAVDERSRKKNDGQLGWGGGDTVLRKRNRGERKSFD